MNIWKILQSTNTAKAKQILRDMIEHEAINQHVTDIVVRHIKASARLGAPLELSYRFLEEAYEDAIQSGCEKSEISILGMSSSRDDNRAAANFYQYDQYRTSKAFQKL